MFLLVGLIASAAIPSGTAASTCYWDCCKMACSWDSKGLTPRGPYSCDAGGGKQSSQSIESGCKGGTAFACPSMGCWSVNSSFGYGTVATQIMRGGAAIPRSETCCRCFQVSFTSGGAAGKKMIVQSTNEGTYSGNHFDFAIPGSGVGEYNKGCKQQFPSTPASAWGKDWGGVSTAAQCDQLPSILKQGCHFRFDFGLNNPSLSFQTVTCPSEIVSVTGCRRADEGS
jgi:hypothetical protein